MSEYSFRDRVLLAEIEVTPGTDPTPAIGSNAFRCEVGGGIRYNLSLEDPDEYTGTLDDEGGSPNGGFAGFSGTVLMRGSGVPETPPEFDALLRSCGLAATATGAAVSGTTQAIAAGSITLASSGTSSSNDAYIGMPITADPDGNGNQTRLVRAYNGTTKVALLDRNWTGTPSGTPTYTIPKNVRYRPASSGLENVTIWDYMNRRDGGSSRLKKLNGGAGNLSINLAPRQSGRISFEHRGLLLAPTDVSAPGTPTLAAVQPPPFLAATIYAGGVQAKLSSAEITLGAEVSQVDDATAEFGYGLAGVTGRQVGGRLVLPQELLSNRNAFAAWRDQTEAVFSAIWGATAGNRWALLLPRIRYSGATDENVSGFAHEGLPFRAVGLNKGMVLCQW